MLRILLAYNYAKELSVKIEKHFDDKQRAGTYTPARLPYGYKKIQSNDVVKWGLEEKTSSIVMNIFEMAKQGISGYSIAKTLNLQDIPSPSGSYWTAVSVRRVLTNRSYLGEFVTHKTKTDLLQKKKVTFLPESQWIYHKEHHTPIIDVILFDIVQQSLAVKGKSLQKGITTEDFFQGKLYCGICSRKLKRKKANGGAIYYVCPMKDEVGAACSNKSKRAEKLKTMVFSAIKGKIYEVREQKDTVARYETSPYRKHKEEQDCMRLIELKLQSDFQFKLFEKLLERQVDNDIQNKDDLRGLYQHIKITKKYIGIQIEAIEKENFDYKVARSLRATRMSAYLKHEQASELSFEMLDTLVSRILVLPAEIQIAYKVETTISLNLDTNNNL